MTIPPTIAVIGTGYVGLSTAVLFSELGHVVAAIDRAQDRVEMLAGGHSPIVEPGLERLLRRGLASGSLSFTNDYTAALREAEFIFICVRNHTHRL